MTTEKRMTMKQRCLLNLHTELATFFELLACSIPGIEMTELPAQSLSIYLRVENYRVVRKWSFLKLLPSVYLLASLYLKKPTSPRM